MRIELLEKIEGEAFLKFQKDKKIITDVKVIFPHYRGIEEILRGRNPWDALVINPRICGICGHAHLQATAMVLESIFQITITQKAQKIREITRFCEIIQNHIKWFYLVIFHELGILYDFTKVHHLIITINKLLALFSGQWPHSSYCVIGGVTCDPTSFEIYQAKTLIRQIKDQFIQLIGELHDPLNLTNDLQKLYHTLQEKELLLVGKSHDRFITFSQDSHVSNIKLLHGQKRKTKLTLIEENEQKRSYAKNVTYNGKYYETGPLARLMQQTDPFIRYFHRRFKDSITTRIIARIYEVSLLIEKIIDHLATIDLSQPSVVESKMQDGTAIISIEAARGSLIHQATIHQGKIETYNIITPTQWNLSNGTSQNPSVIQKAIIGTSDEKIANLIFRSFDICSVCTTH
ncbi:MULTISPECIES: nickel-dependent hydrogenase large subunit [unclassified Nitratiruptor]|uniref:nickel-dependent hydrogenase large subunit n=1 Tax=unclassified Nitratiruptor TaxID=2624044 RepID=UPI00191514D4|nr:MULTISPECIES: nickel-dependent hydrogenase large subunit [unclassified Nitratiruptor]BCD60323.1 hydrogenase large subunit [Nitratiruptor sp. YY08-10]BCD64188.1 hydrogenase large subunit [Nitratiruptor sp. YY08-14]